MKTFTIEASFGDQEIRSWLAGTGQHGTKLTELMKLGEMAIGYDITRINATTFNFRMSVDEKTLAEIRGRTN